MDIIIIILLIVVIVLLVITLVKLFSKKHYQESNSQDFSNLKIEIENKLTNMQTMMLNSLQEKIQVYMDSVNEKIESMLKKIKESLDDIKNDLNQNAKQTEVRLEKIENRLETSMRNLQNDNNGQLEKIRNTVNEQISILLKTIKDNLDNIKTNLNQNAKQTEERLEKIENKLETSMRNLQNDNKEQLEKIRHTVDEKLDKTLNERLSSSFKLVQDNLSAVERGLGEMQSLVNDVGDLKKVLSNVKTRGILGETQLGNILEQILNSEQYETNIVTKKGSKDPVEFAIKIPNGDGNITYLPIDAKFPLDTYSKVLEAYDTGDKDKISSEITNLKSKIKLFAKDIHTKYIDIPNTTDFGVMFLPIEGLYAEVVKSGVTEDIQREYKIIVSGPTTMGALLNSLQIGFKNFALQKRSNEVWKVLGAVKSEFDNFKSVLEKAQKKINQANDEIEQLVGTRTNKINHALKSVERIDYDKASAIIDNMSQEDVA